MATKSRANRSESGPERDLDERERRRCEDSATLWSGPICKVVFGTSTPTVSRLRTGLNTHERPKRLVGLIPYNKL